MRHPEHKQFSVAEMLEHGLTSAEDSQFAGAYRYTFAAPRTYGVKLSAQW